VGENQHLLHTLADVLDLVADRTQPVVRIGNRHVGAQQAANQAIVAGQQVLEAPAYIANLPQHFVRHGKASVYPCHIHRRHARSPGFSVLVGLPK
jgi:hypothetical protein